MSSKIRVLFISSPAAIGADTWVHHLVLRHLDRSRFEVHAAAQPARTGMSSSAFADLTGTPGISLRPTNFGTTESGIMSSGVQQRVAKAIPAAGSLVSLAAYVRKHRIQIVHSTDRPRDAISCVALSRLTGAKSVVHVHVKYGDWMGRGVKWAFGNAHALTGVSRFVSSSLVDAGHHPHRVHTALNAIVPADWDPSADPRVGRSALGVPEGAPLLVSVARLFRWKGQADLILALPKVRRAVPGTKLVIVGADYPEGSGVSAELKALARELRVEDHVIFTGQRRDVASLLCASDVFALPSFEEPFGLVFAEAMAMKKPVVALDNGGTPEVVRHGVTGLLSKPGDVRALTANLVTLLGDPALRARMGDVGRKDVEARFGPDRLASDVAGIYSSLLPS